MKKILFFLAGIALTSGLSAQIPTNCIEIESILVDACGAPEGENEMVRFQVGPAALNVAAMSVSWPNNTYLGCCQNATTASVVATWNSTITECGLLVEPTGGILPAGERVILVSSTNVIPGANSFAGLSDTIYVIFQCAGNTSGHFANYGVGLRTLSITFGACTDVVTYDRAQLVDMFGVPGAADGGTVNFNWPGTPSYLNTGCNAPVLPLIVNAGGDQGGFCVGDTVDLNPVLQGGFSGYTWTGGTGNFINPTSAFNAYYIVGSGDSSPISIFFTATNCNGSYTDTMRIYMINPTPVSISPGGPISLCAGDNVTLTAIGPGPFTWSTSATTSSINVNSPGNYIVSQTSTCGISYDTVVVTISGAQPTAVITPLGPTVLCAGDQVILVASGGTSYNWNTSDATSSIIATLAGNYSVIVTNGCGSDTAYLTLTTNASPQANISPSSPITLCGGTVDVTASGVGTFTWSTGGTGTVETFNAPGSYYVVASNICGTDTAFFTIVGGSIAAGLTATPTIGPSPLTVNFTDISIGATSWTWIFGDGNTSTSQNSSNTYLYPGTYICTLIVSNNGGCSDSTTTIIIVDSCLYTIKIPNVITADGNGMNDAFFVTGTCVDQFNAYIFDRWGVKVFEYNDVNGTWTGTTLTGTEVNKGIYTYVIHIRDYNGDVHEYPGFIHVFD